MNCKFYHCNYVFEDKMWLQSDEYLAAKKGLTTLNS